MRYALIDLWTGQRVLLSKTDVKTMQEVLHRASHNHRPSQVQDAVPRMRGNCTGPEGDDCKERQPAERGEMGLVGERKSSDDSCKLMPNGMYRGERIL